MIRATFKTELKAKKLHALKPVLAICVLHTKCSKTHKVLQCTKTEFLLVYSLYNCIRNIQAGRINVQKKHQICVHIACTGNEIKEQVHETTTKNIIRE